ncbi:MAG TPA: aspartate aminotransferase family protein [Candidatus Hydrogenedentes bacterium]|nr:aspartate aminotransferase family protein [Candidatus Hydrogenedentota bacterium]
MIHHENEPLGNELREAWSRLVGKGQMTWTPTMAVIQRAKGCYLWTVDGRRLVDFSSGVLVNNIGYAHRGFEARLVELMKGAPRNAYNTITPIQVEASSMLLKSLSESNPRMEKLLWAASGSEAIQKAMWCALHRYPDWPYMLASKGGFHGKKGLAADITGDSSANPFVRMFSFPLDDHSLAEEQVWEELERYWSETDGKISLLITEPYLGAKGSYHPPKWYHKCLERWCRERDVTFIFDEVQSCFGRTGHMYAFETYGVQPDMVVLGKGMASGVPTAAVAGRADLIDALDYGEGSDTFSAHPEACAAVIATLEIFEKEEIVRNARKIGVRLGKALDRLQEKFSFIKAVRGEGMVYGIEMDTPETAGLCVLEAYRAKSRRGVHFLGPLAGKVLRVSPPLILDRETLIDALYLLDKAWSRILRAS